MMIDYDVNDGDYMDDDLFFDCGLWIGSGFLKYDDDDYGDNDNDDDYDDDQDHSDIFLSRSFKCVYYLSAKSFSIEAVSFISGLCLYTSYRFVLWCVIYIKFLSTVNASALYRGFFWFISSILRSKER